MLVLYAILLQIEFCALQNCLNIMLKHFVEDKLSQGPLHFKSFNLLMQFWILGKYFRISIEHVEPRSITFW